MRKKKILFLGYHDSNFAGHTYYVYNSLKNITDAVVVTCLGLSGKANHCFWPLNGKGFTLWERIRYFRFSKIFYFLWVYLYSIFRFGCFPVKDKRHPEYDFIGFEFLPYSAGDIMKKCPKGFIPEIIWIGWSSRFISSKIIYDLYKLTKAKIVISFVDEAPMTGGCHYPNECRGYLGGCKSCPALSCGKKIAAAQMRVKEKYLKDIPVYLIGSPYDMRLAKETEMFKNAICFPSVSKPNATITPQKEAREALGIPKEKFVVLIGATNIEGVRKGFSYTIDSINIANRETDDLFLLVIGSTNEAFRLKFPNVEMKELGFVDTNKMVMAYCAADCFLSTTIADSGPQMVNYSVATGTPVVSFSMGIAQDLVLHRKTGYIANFKDSEDLAKGILFLQGLSKEEREQMAEECIKIINEKSSVKGFRQTLLEIM